MVEFRLKTLTLSYVITLSFYLLVSVHLVELIPLIIYFWYPLWMLEIILHKLI